MADLFNQMTQFQKDELKRESKGENDDDLQGNDPTLQNL
jgi:hypothetical protein